MGIVDMIELIVTFFLAVLAIYAGIAVGIAILALPFAALWGAGAGIAAAYDWITGTTATERDRARRLAREKRREDWLRSIGK